MTQRHCACVCVNIVRTSTDQHTAMTMLFIDGGGNVHVKGTKNTILRRNMRQTRLTSVIDADVSILQIGLADENLLFQIVETLQVRFDGENFHRSDFRMAMDAHFVDTRHFYFYFFSSLSLAT